MTVLIEFKTDVFRTALSCFLTIRGYLGWSRFYLSGDFLLWLSVCVSLSWRMASEATVGLGLCLGECRVSGDWWFFDGGGNGYDRESNWLNWSCYPLAWIGRVWSGYARYLMMLKGKAIRVEGWVCWFDRLGQTDVLWFTGGTWGWVIFWLSCLFDSIGRGSRCWLSISDFNRWSGSRFAIVAGLNCVVDWWFTLFVYQEFWSSMVAEYWLVLMGSVVKSSMTPGWVKSRFLNGICLWFSGRRSWWPKMKLEMWVIVVWIKGITFFVESRYRLVVYSVGWLSIHHHIEIRNLRRFPLKMMKFFARHQQISCHDRFDWAWDRGMASPLSLIDSES